MFPWYALWVRSRHEKSVASILTLKGYETFLPMHKARRRWSDRNQDVELPLISGYVFCRFDPSNRMPVDDDSRPGADRERGPQPRTRR